MWSDDTTGYDRLQRLQLDLSEDRALRGNLQLRSPNQVVTSFLGSPPSASNPEAMAAWIDAAGRISQTNQLGRKAQSEAPHLITEARQAVERYADVRWPAHLERTRSPTQRTSPSLELD